MKYSDEHIDAAVEWWKTALEFRPAVLVEIIEQLRAELADFREGTSYQRVCRMVSDIRFERDAAREKLAEAKRERATDIERKRARIAALREKYAPVWVEACPPLPAGECSALLPPVEIIDEVLAILDDKETPHA